MSVDKLTEDEARAKLKASIPWKGAHKVAAEIGVSKAHLSEMLSGKKAINEKALAFIGYHRAIVSLARKDRLQSVSEGA